MIVFSILLPAFYQILEIPYHHFLHQQTINRFTAVDVSIISHASPAPNQHSSRNSDTDPIYVKISIATKALAAISKNGKDSAVNLST